MTDRKLSAVEKIAHEIIALVWACSLSIVRYAEIGVSRIPDGEAELTMSDQDPFGELRQRYRDFARHEAAGRSAQYEALATGIAESDEILGFIASLPPANRQPNLILAAVRLLFGVPSSLGDLARIIAQHGPEIRQLVLHRSTQTNEPARCAALLPVIAAIPGFLALLELGASAGLCLLPDRYAFDYGTVTIRPRDESVIYPTFPCRISGPVPLPSQHPDVRWRRGIDLNPVNISDPEQLRWLEALVWPGQEDRFARLRVAVATAQRDPPPVFRGDLLTDLERHAADAPSECTLIVFHSAVLVYLAPEDRAQLINRLLALEVTWIGCESPKVLPGCAEQLRMDAGPSDFVVCVNGKPVALADPHGRSLRWCAGDSGAAPQADA